MSDALTVAKWCWPAEPGDAWEVSETLSLVWRRRGLPMAFMPSDANQVARAERALIERGLAEEYGLALWNQLAGHEYDGLLGYVNIAHLATTPLDVRVRAMAAVIRAQEAK